MICSYTTALDQIKAAATADKVAKGATEPITRAGSIDPRFIFGKLWHPPAFSINESCSTHAHFQSRGIAASSKEVMITTINLRL